MSRSCASVVVGREDSVFIPLTFDAQSALLLFLILNTGDVQHLQVTRRNELLKSATILGVRSSDDVIVPDDDRFPDGMTLKWEPDDVASALSRTFVSPAIHATPYKPGTFTPSSSNINIDVLITFDRKGVSSHANHVSLYYGALHWLRRIDQTGAAVTLYSLTTTNIMRKYMFFLDSPLSVFSHLFKVLTSRSSHNLPEDLLFHNDVTGYRRAQNAMTNGHVSQMLWFRWGWITLSRYMWINNLKRQHPAASAIALAPDAQLLIKNSN
jgi:N-acetylglucosaminylphosphatidylinositol deacetylase